MPLDGKYCDPGHLVENILYAKDLAPWTVTKFRT